ncbi:MAG: flagellar biosynthesis regulator FlaF [Xanthobacteraceae bacterium]
MRSAIRPRRAKTSNRKNPREAEAALLLDAALRLQEVQSRWEESRANVDDALHYNHQRWGIFLASICNAKNPLPCEVRHTIANLGLFVSRETTAIAADPRPERLTALIGINRDLAAGLLGHA